jgi:hypothetical protein
MQTYRTDLRLGEALTIDGGRVTVTLQEKSGQRARLVFTAEDGVHFSKEASARTGATQAMRGIKSSDI